MSDKPWQERLSQMLADLRAGNSRPRIAVVGVGHELRGDDAAGVAVARLLNSWIRTPFLQVIEAGAAPENCCGLIFRFSPDLVLFVDAAQMGADPGTVRWLDWHEVTTVSVTTHAVPLPLLADYLAVEVGCPVGLLGIQPADTSMGVFLSYHVTMAVEATARALVRLLFLSQGVTA